MSNYIGDFTEDHDSLNVKFLTASQKAADNGAPTTLAGTPVVSVYKNNSLIQSVAGITLTVDFDGITGLNDVLIDLSSDAFYEVNAEYQVIITAGTVGGDSIVGRVIASFGIQHRSLERVVSIVSNLPTGAAAPSVAPEAAVITTGSETNTYASAQSLDGGYHEISDVGGVIDMYYQFDIGDNNVGTSVAMNGRLEGKDDVVGVYAYNWVTTAWNQIGAMVGSATDSPDGVVVFTVTHEHTGTGGDLNKVRIRGLASGLTGATFFIDRAVMRYNAQAAPTVIEVRTELDNNSVQLAAIVEDTNEMQLDLVNGGRLDIILDAILADTNELQLDDIPTVLATIASYIDTEIGTIINAVAAVDAKVLTVDTVVDGIATAVSTVDTVVDGIQTDLSNTTDGLGALKALIDTLDTINDAIKAKTDQLTFTKALEVDTNTQSINNATVVGDGNATPWDGV